MANHPSTSTYMIKNRPFAIENVTVLNLAPSEGREPPPTRGRLTPTTAENSAHVSLVKCGCRVTTSTAVASVLISMDCTR